jgi:hypothetical protein
LKRKSARLDIIEQNLKQKVSKPPLTKEQKEKKEKEEKKEKTTRKPRTKMVHPVTMNRRLKAEAVLNRKRNELMNSKLPMAKKVSPLHNFIGVKKEPTN